MPTSIKENQLKVGFQFMHFDDDEQKYIKSKITEIDRRKLYIEDIDSNSEWQGLIWDCYQDEIIDDVKKAKNI